MLTLEFDISTDAKNFMSFITTLRSKVRDENNPILVDGVARLTAEVDNPELFDIILRSGNNVVTLRVRTDNLYVIGFSNNADTWYEFSHDNDRPRMIEGSTRLTYNGSYTNNGISSLNEEEAILGRPALVDAINGLANFGGATDDTTRARLRAVIVNFIESARFDSIANRVDRQMSNPSESPGERRLRSGDISLIRSWGTLSRALRNRVNNPEGPNAFRRFADAGIHNYRDAVAALGLALIGVTVCSRQRRSTSSSSNRRETDIVGLTLVQVVGVLVKNIDGENPGQLYGTIGLTDGLTTVKMFNRDKRNAQSIRAGEWVDITWPTVAIFGADDFVIDVDLMDHDRLSPDDEVARGQVAWNSRDALSRQYDQIQGRLVNGQYGCVEVRFAVLTDAVIANMDVVMLDGDGENAPEVYGEITSSVGMAYCGGKLDYWLFCKERDQAVVVNRGTSIQLRMPVISAPRCSLLNVSADLWDKDTVSPDDHIADSQGRPVAFKPRLSGNDYRDIHGKYGRVRVYVTWSL